MKLSTQKPAIPFTQYLMPYGERRPAFYDCAPELAQQAAALLNAGCTFEIELLTTGLVSMSVTQGEIQVAHKLCDNGPGIEKHVEKMVADALVTLREK